MRPDLPLIKWMEEHHPKVLADDLTPQWGLQMDDAQRPNEREMRENSRSRSAILHVLRMTKAVRIADLERVAYPLRGWAAAPAPPPPPPVTLLYDAAQGEGGGSTPGKKEKKEAKDKKEKSAKKEKKSSKH